MKIKSTALIVDDEPLILDTHKEILEGYGFNVFIELNAKKGLDQFRITKPKLVLTDLEMPGAVKSEELIKEIRKASPHTVIFMVSGSATVPSWASSTKETLVEKWALSIGADEFFEKPIDFTSFF